MSAKDIPAGQAEAAGTGKTIDPCIAQKITVSYDPKKEDSVIEGTYTMTGMKILIAVLVVFGIVATVFILSGVNISRRPDWH